MRRSNGTIAASTLLVLVVISCGLFVPAVVPLVVAEQDGDYTFIVNEGVARITGYVGTGGEVTIPSTLGGYAVEIIGEHAFANLDTISSVMVPDSVVTIEDYAFRHCTSMTSITIGINVMTIGYCALDDCSSLRSITFLGMKAPTSVSTPLASGASVELRGHAYSDSDFPAPGYEFHRLTMGETIDGGWNGMTLEITIPLTVAALAVIGLILIAIYTKKRR